MCTQGAQELITWLPKPTPSPITMRPMMSIPIWTAAAHSVMPMMKHTPAISIVSFLPSRLYG